MTHAENAPPPDRPLSVIVLTDHAWVNGGQAKVAIDSAMHVKRLGHHVRLIAGVGPVDERLQDVGIECHVVGEYDILSDPNRARAATRGIWNRQAARVLARCVAESEPSSTVIHAHGWAKALSPSIGPVMTNCDAAHVYTLHDYFLACPNGGFYDHRRGEICERRPLGADCLTTSCDARSNVHKLWRLARQAVLKTAGNMPHGLREIIYLAPEQRSILEPFFTSEARWHHLPNAVDRQPLERIAVERNELFLFIGRLSPEKGAEVAAAAAKLAAVPIAFCGDGERAEAVLQANPDAIMPGWLSEDELKEWVQRARCLVFPSLLYECYPLAVADALRHGVPVLTSRACVAASMIIDGVNGLHVETGDVAAWADAMTRLQSDELACSFGEAAFSAGRELLSHDSYTARLVGIYQDAISRKQAVLNGRALW